MSAGSLQHDAQTPRPATSPARDLPHQYPPPDYLIPLDTTSIIDSLQSSTNVSAGSRQHDAQTPRPAMSPAGDLPHEYPPPDYLIPLDTQAFVDSLYGPNNTSPGSGPQHAMPRVRHIPHVVANENLPDDYLIPLPAPTNGDSSIAFPGISAGSRQLERSYGVSTLSSKVRAPYYPPSETDHYDTLDDVEYHVTSSQGHREPPNIYSRVRAGVSFTGHPEPSGPYRNMPGPSGAN